MQVTKSFKKNDIKRKWYLIDLKGQVVGRAASKIAKILKGKHRPQYTPHNDVGDFVVAINAESIAFTGKKWNDKMYYHYTGYIGGIKEYSAEKLRERKPEEIILRAVKGMMPRGPLARQQLKKLKIYAGNQHPHSAQQPEILDIKAFK